MLFFITISCASAADNETTDTLTIEEDLETSELSEETEETLDFTQLNDKISTSTESEITLENNYTYNSTTDTGLIDGIA